MTDKLLAEIILELKAIRVLIATAALMECAESEGQRDRMEHVLWSVLKEGRDK